MSHQIMPITLLTGYLGAGKTTLLNHVLRNQQGYQVAVIVNDIGEINIDADLIAEGGQVTEGDQSLVPLQNGCICCTLKMDLIAQVMDLIRMDRFDYILIEASGVCEPLPIAQTLTLIDGSQKGEDALPQLCRLDNIVTVVDAKRMADEFVNGAALLRKDLEENDVENLLIQQIEFCNTIILNKVDMVSEEDKRAVRKVIRALQPTARIIEANYGAVDCADILDTYAFDFEEAAQSAGWAEALMEGEEEEPETDEYGISTFVYREKRPFRMEAFTAFAGQRFPDTIIRCKGPIWFQEEPETAYLFEQAGQEITATPMGRWTHRRPENRLAVIGRNMDKEAICRAFDECLGKLR